MTYRDEPEIAKKYKSKKWQKLRLLKKNVSPFCERCLINGVYTPARIIHHKEYITDLNYLDDNVFYNLDNLESLCQDCHNVFFNRDNLESLCQDCHNKEHFGEKQNYFFDINGDIMSK